MRPHATLIIIGAGIAGIAGVSAALGARAQAPDARILVFGEEPLKPYDRTSLSKQMLAEGAVIKDFPLLPDEDYPHHGIELRPGETIARIDPEVGTVTTDGGVTERYDALVIATGAEVRRFPAGLEAADIDDRVHYLRSAADARRLRERLRGADRLVVIGGDRHRPPQGHQRRAPPGRHRGATVTGRARRRRPVDHPTCQKQLKR